MENFLKSKGWEQTIKKLQTVKNDPEKTFEHFDWKLDFPEVLNPIVVGENGGFDIVIANPPYLKERDNAHIFNPVNVSRMGRLYHQGKMDYWYYFLHLAMDISSPNSAISFITSRYWINSQGAKKLISRVQEMLAFVSVVDIGKLKVFGNVAGHHMIHTYSKVNRDTFTYKKIINDIRVIEHEYSSDNLTIELLSNTSVFTDSEIIFASQELKSSFTNTVGAKYDLSQGVVEACDKVSSKQFKKVGRNDVSVGDGVFVLSKPELNKLNLNSNERKHIVKYLDPNDIQAYSIEPQQSKFLIYSDKNAKTLIATNGSFPNLKKHLQFYSDFITSSNAPFGLHRPRESKYFLEKKILFKGMFERNEFAIDTEKHFVGMSFISIVEKSPSKGFSLEFLLGLLNSKYGLNWFYTYGKKRGAGVDIGVEKLRTFPLPDKPNKKVEAIVKQIIANKSEHGDTTKYEQELDTIVYRLYNLGHAEVKQIDPEFALSKKEYEAIELE